MTPEVFAIFGPTASGKSAVAQALADALGTEVVSADSMQVYRGLPILTNQPERGTRLVALWPLDHEASVGEFAGLAQAAIDELVEDRGAAVVAGGTGLYLRAALAELQLPTAVSPAIRTRWEQEYDADPGGVYATLESRDPAAAARVHRNDRRRVVRALELAEAGASLAPGDDRLWAEDTRRPTLIAGLELAPDELERRIVERTADMFRKGVVEEVRRALASGAVSRTAGQALGLREIAELPPDEAQEAVLQRTRQYAAYQRKWMRRIPGIVMIEAASEPDRPARLVAHEILEVARTR
jgi:tRNA dimethylallyltransferase